MNNPPGNGQALKGDCYGMGVAGCRLGCTVVP